MFGNIKNKLRSNRGASMILVLALFFVCVMVSSIVIFNASNGLSRNAQRTRQQRGYLAVSSAADFVVEELKLATTYTGKNVFKKYGCEDCNIPGEIVYNGTVIYGYRLDSAYIGNPLDDNHIVIRTDADHVDRGDNKQTDPENTIVKGCMGDLLVRAAEHVYLLGTPYSEQIKLEMAISDERMPVVNCKFTMNVEYGIECLLTTEESSYSITITSSAIVNDAETVTKDVESDKHILYYKKHDAINSSFKDERIDAFPISIEVTTILKTVTWGIPNIEKGALVD